MGALVSKSMSQALAAIDVRRKRVLKKAEKICEMAMRGSEIDNPPEPDDTEGFVRPVIPEGWTAHEYRVALDARQPARSAPMYLSLAQRIAENAQRIEAGKEDNGPKSLNIGTINIVAPRDYKVIDVEVVEKK